MGEVYCQAWYKLANGILYSETFFFFSALIVVNGILTAYVFYINYLTYEIVSFPFN